MPDRQTAAPTEARSGKGKRRFTVDALFTDSRPQAIGVTDLITAKEIRLDRIEPDPDQPRRTFDAIRLEELAESIRIEGVLQPIVVRYDDGRDTYVIVHGERRWRASAIAGLDVIPALVRDVPEERRLIQQLMENIVRDDLNAVDRAAALRTLKQQLGEAPWDTVAAAVGIKRSRLFQLLSTEKLPEPIQDDIRAGRLSEKQSRALQNLPATAQAALRDEIIERDLPAETALLIARRLRALPEPADEPAARAAIQTVLDDLQSSQPDDPDEADAAATAAKRDPLPLLEALASSAGGDADAQARLGELLDGRVSPRAHRRLPQEAAGLAGALARLHHARPRERAKARPVLLALREALDAVLNQDDATR